MQGWFARVSAAVLSIAVVLGLLLGQEAFPERAEPLTRYLQRLVRISTDAAEGAYLRAVLLFPTVAVGPKTSEPRDTAGIELDELELARKKAQTLTQETARNEIEINAQQQVSVERYKEATADTDEHTLHIPVQPDEVRRKMPPADRTGPVMRCGEALPAVSVVTTRDVELKATSTYHGFGGGQYQWSYEITFINRGEATVQMLTRHWIFVNSIGKLETEVKGPGARGVTPVLPPGARWSYQSGTSLTTPFGSMYGSFQFEVLKGSSSERSFSARVGRLGLLDKTGRSKDVPCIDEVESMLPATSVLSTERVILGVTGHFLGREGGKYRFGYDVQINNARELAIDVIGHKWEAVTSSRKRAVVAEGDGVGGMMKSRNHFLLAGDAFRVQGILVSDTEEANAKGTYRVRLNFEDGKELEIEASTDFMGLSAKEGQTHVADFVSDPNLR